MLMKRKRMDEQFCISGPSSPKNRKVGLVGGPAHVMSNSDPELLRVRQFMREQIYHVLHQRQVHMRMEVHLRMDEWKLRDIVRRLDEGLLRASVNKEEYINLDTLESRLHNYVKGIRPRNQNEQLPVVPPINQNQQLHVPPHPLPNKVHNLLRLHHFMQEKINVGGPAHVMSNSDPELLRARQIMQQQIYHVLHQRQVHLRMDEGKLRDIVRRLDEGLLRSSVSKEDYLNLDTLQNRLCSLIKPPYQRNQNRQYPQWMSQSRTSNSMATSADASVVHRSNESEVMRNNMQLDFEPDLALKTANGQPVLTPPPKGEVSRT